MAKSGNEGASRVTVAMTAILVVLFLGAGHAHASLLYSASLKNGDYGGGFLVGAYPPGGWNASGSIGGNLAPLGVLDSALGVTFTTNHDVINYSLGADGLGGSSQSVFRTTGTINVRFKADWQTFNNGQAIVDNYGFNQFNSGQSTFAAFFLRDAGPDTFLNTPDDLLTVRWDTWNSAVFYTHPLVLTTMDEWHDLSLAWDGVLNKYDIWIDGALAASDSSPLGPWGASYLGLGSAYNFALGEIHERILGDSSPHDVMFSDLEIWDEYHPRVAEQAIPEPATLALMLLGVAALGRRRRRRAR